ncbi:amphiphysin isoform X2 [Trachinotus anak]|uniref:amphiphysin isoform X2 n=1 Tax=Trachinotus anak TaxID=443729 RepID=UPI0039F16CDF
MAEIKTGIFAKNVQKRLNRAQEKVLQKLGKADETKDEQFEQVVINFRRQESEGSRLQREMKTYMSAIKGMQQASINLTQSLHEVYEPDWHGKDDVMTIGKDCDALWEDFHNKLVDSTLLNLDAYLQQFPDLKTRVAKRSRKLIDYDSARHHVETLQASGMKNDRKIMKAEDELKKAQRVFDELNVGLQDELPTLWDSRVGFYINTYKSVTSLEAKFHREISLVCRQLYEVMTKLAEQHSDKMFTIQGAPSDSGPLRLARTPSPPEDESPPESPDASSNHMLRPVSPGPPRPKSPTQFKKGPPVPPPPKVTPTKEVAEEQIIDLFGGEFLPAPSPSQPNERPGESLLDLDFDAFQPDESVSPIPQTAIPWDMWSANTQTAQPAADAGFMADWSADFGAVPANGDASSRAEAPEAPAVGLEGAQDGAQGGAQGWPQADGWLPGGNTATPPQESEAATAAESEVSKWDSQTNPNFHPTAVRGDENKTGQADSGGGVAGHEDRRTSTPGLIFTNEYGEQIEDSTEDRREKWARSPDGSGSEYETAEEWGDGGLGGGWASADDELSYEDRPPVSASEGWAGGADGVAPDLSQTVEQVSPVSNTVYGNLSETHGAGAFDSDPFAETQGECAFDSIPSAETQGGGVFDSDPFTETGGASVFDSDPFAETQGGGVPDSVLSGETQERGVFGSDPFAETQVGGAFDSDPFGETQGVVAFDSDPFAEIQGASVFDSDPFAETQGGGAFDSVPSAETQGIGMFHSDPFAEAKFENKGGGFQFNTFAETSAEGGGGSEWDADPFANSFPAASSGIDCPASTTTSWQEVSDSSGFESSVTRQNSASICGMVEDVNIPRVHKEPENSDMSEDEAANRRFGKLYQELDTEQEEVSNAFNGFSQDASATSFFANFDKMNEANAESTRAPGASEIQAAASTEPAKEQNKPAASPDGDEPAAPHAGDELAAPPAEHEPVIPLVGDEPATSPAKEEPAASPLGGEVDEHTALPAGEVEEPAAPPVGEEDTAESSGSPMEEKPASKVGSPSSEKPELSEEKMPIPSVVIEPASSNEGDDDRDADIISPTAISDNEVTAQNQTIKHMSPSGAVSGLPDDFLYKVETMHDFEAANSDELELKRGDVVLVVPTASVEDQDAGWLTGIKESDWVTLGAGAQKGLFPENFTQHLE